MSLGKRFFLVTTGLFIVTLLILELVTFRMTTVSFTTVMKEFQSSMSGIQDMTTASIRDMSSLRRRGRSVEKRCQPWRTASTSNSFLAW